MQADHKKVERYLKTARGQIDGILRMIEDDRYCIDISTQLMATQALLNKANKEILAEHMRHCVNEASTGENREEKIEEMVKIIDKLVKQSQRTLMLKVSMFFCDNNVKIVAFLSV